MPQNLKTLSLTVAALALLASCQPEKPAPPPPAIGLHQAALEGNLEAVRQHIAAGSDLNQKEPTGGSTPLITAAVFGQTEAARALILAGADVNQRNNEGSTALHTAAFLCQPAIVECLLENGADRGVRNGAGATALESVQAPFEAVRGIYDLLAAALGPLGLELDYAQLQATRPQIAAMLRQGAQ